MIDEPWIGGGRARVAPRDLDRGLALILVAALLLALLICALLLTATGG